MFASGHPYRGRLIQWAEDTPLSCERFEAWNAAGHLDFSRNPTSNVLTLAIETSGPIGSLALFNGSDLLEERTLQLGTQHGQSLIPELGRLLGDIGKSPRDCRLLAVSTGPGSFTGLRVGIVCAKTWAFATGSQVVAVDTHHAIAANSPDDVRRVQVMSDAQRGDVFHSTFERALNGDWTETIPLGFQPVNGWMDALKDDDVVCGPGVGRMGEQLAGRCRVLDSSFARPRAAVVGRLGLKQAERNAFADPWTLEPRYVRRSSAEEKWDLRPRR